MKKRTVKMIAAAAVIGGIGGIIACREKIWGFFASLHSWQKEVDRIRERYSTDRKHEILFYGASNFAMWDQMEDDMADYRVQNHAFGGSKDTDLVKFADQILYPYDPAVVFFQTGSNDYVMMKGTDEEKAAKCMAYKKQMFHTFHEKLPDAKFVIMSGLLLPGRTQYLDMTLRINRELKELAETEEWLYYVDAEALTYDGKTLDKSLFREDMIHLNHEGELRWYREYIEPQIRELIEKYGLEGLRKCGDREMQI